MAKNCSLSISVLEIVRRNQMNFRLRDLALVAVCVPVGNYLYEFLRNDNYVVAFERSYFQLIPLAVIALIWWSRYRANRIQLRRDLEFTPDRGVD
jgi:hypothetical protein